MKANYHTHTALCNHATGTIKEYIEEAIKGGLEILGFSDHCPYLFDNGHYSYFRMTAEEAKGYVSELQSLREEYKNDIKIFIGYEAEYYPLHFDKTYDYLNSLGCDYLILGQHFTKNEYDGVASSARTESKEVLSDYINQSIQALKTRKFAYMAHPDLINFCGDLDFYNTETEKLCRAANEYSVPLEINFLGIEDNRHYPRDNFWKIASKCGNTVIFGCDAHCKQNVTNAEAEKAASALAQKYGLNVTEKLSFFENKLENSVVKH